MAFTKLFSDILHSTVWQESAETRCVWVTLLAMANQHGEIMASIPGLAKAAGVTLEQCETALDIFHAPDPYSRSTACDGRRIEPIDGGWVLVNYQKYRNRLNEDDQKEKNRQRQQRYRDKKKVTRNAEALRNVTPVTNNENNDKQKQKQKQKKTEKSNSDNQLTNQPSAALAPDDGWLVGLFVNLDFEALNRKGENFCRRSGLRLDTVTPELLAEIILMDRIEENFSIDAGNRVRRGMEKPPGAEGKITKPKKYLKSAIRRQCDQHGVALADYEKAVSDAVEAARQP